jgi:protein-disulfide isomerase
MPPKQRPNRVQVPGDRRRPNTRLLLGSVAAALVVTGIAIALSLTLGGNDHKTSAPPTTVAGGKQPLVDGIPQNGLVLGDPRAKITLTEYIDTSCPVCADYALRTFPLIVKSYVRPGKVKIESRLVAFVGPSSERGRQLLLAAARQDKAWQLSEVLYRNQGNEATAWLTDAYARTLAAKVPGLDVEKLFADASSASIQDDATTADAQAQADGVRATPTFLLTTRDGVRHLLGAGNPGFPEFARVLDRAMKE